MSSLRCDIETFSDLDLSKVGVYKYASSPNFRILLFAYCYDDKEVQIVDLANGDEIPGKVYHDLIDECVTKHAFNATFERVCLEKFLGHKLDPSQWQCTMVHSATLGLPMSLESVGEVLKLQEQKITDGKRLIRKFSKPNADGARNLPKDYPAEWQKFKEYCVRDVEVERNIAEKLSAFPMTAQLKREYTLDQQINDRGIGVDMALVENAIKCDEILRAKYSAEMEKVTGLENPNSVKQLRAWLADNGWSMDSLGKKEVAEALESAPEPYRTVLKLRQKLSKTSVKKYTAMQTALCPDSTIKGMFQFHGTRTGRWAGRIVQLQNLAQNHLENIAEVRSQVRNGEINGKDVSTLSELTRTALIPSDGKKFIVADFSSIERIVLAWLAGEMWVVDSYTAKEDLYIATASAMFGVPKAEMNKTHPLRQKGKVADLACGYGGSVGALKAMGALEQGLQESELQGLVDNWRNANPNIVRFWYELEKEAVRAVKTRQITETHGVQFEVDRNILFMTLPSKRRVAYCFPRMQENQFGKMALTFKGVGVVQPNSAPSIPEQKPLGNLERSIGSPLPQKGKAFSGAPRKWVRLFTWGGKLCENCIAGGTQVLTQNGLKPIESISIKDKLWDGEKWVRHQGLINKGKQTTIELNGIWLTPDHQVLTERGWQSAEKTKKLQGFNRLKVRLPNDYGICRNSTTLSVVGSMRLRELESSRKTGFFTSKKLWLQEKRINRQCKQTPRNDSSSSLLGMAFNDRPLQTSNSSSVEKLWRAWDKSVRTVVRKIREFLGRYGFNLQERFDSRQDKQQRQLRTRELQMDDVCSTSTEQKRKCTCRTCKGKTANNSGDCRRNRNKSNNSVLPQKPQRPNRRILDTSEREQQVFDLMNAGDLHRFTVKGTNGELMIVHNCVQSIARDLLANAMQNLDEAGYKIVAHVHDEVVIDAEPTATVEEVCKIMTTPPDWAHDLPLRADGYETPFYLKD